MNRKKVEEMIFGYLFNNVISFLDFNKVFWDLRKKEVKSEM